jgi:hypothetical protein
MGAAMARAFSAHCLLKTGTDIFTARGTSPEEVSIVAEQLMANKLAELDSQRGYLY